MRTMKRLAKGEGYGNVYLEEVPIPTLTPGQVLVRAHTSLISRGSEILRRYRLDGPVDPGMMGYALAGTIVEVGDAARAAGYAPGQRAFVAAPHAEYVAVEVDDGTRFLRVSPDMPWHQVAFLGVARGPVAWAISSGARPTDTVVVLGQGLMGNLVMQAHRARGVGRVLTVDPLALRVRLSRELGADAAIQGGGAEAVAEVRRLTGGRGADVVVDCVGGPPGVASFAGALEMVKADGVVHLVGLYHGAPLPLDASRMMGKLLIGGYRLDEPLGPLRARTATLIEEGQIRVEPLITHRFPAARAAEAFALLDGHLEQALGVLLEWPQGPEGPEGSEGPEGPAGA
jgi:L-iditol 2-dehydrogenase